MFDPFPNLPHQIRQYKLLSVLGKGGYGVVYKAINTTYNMEMAIKVFPIAHIESLNKTDSEINKQQKSFDSEVRSLMNLDHPNVIRMYDYFKENGILFLVLEFCNGGTKLDEVKFLRSLTTKEKISICQQIASALDYCHKMKIAHRDIKASNVLFDSFGRVKIADFGLSEKMEFEHHLNDFVGSLIYAPPELIQRKAFSPFKGDIWSLGVLFHRILTGKYPWSKMKTKEDIKNSIIENEFSRNSKTFVFSNLIRQMIVTNPDLRLPMNEVLVLINEGKKKYLAQKTTIGKIQSENSLPQARSPLSKLPPLVGINKLQAYNSMANSINLTSSRSSMSTKKKSSRSVDGLKLLTFITPPASSQDS